MYSFNDDEKTDEESKKKLENSRIDDDFGFVSIDGDLKHKEADGYYVNSNRQNNYGYFDNNNVQNHNNRVDNGYYNYPINHQRNNNVYEKHKTSSVIWIVFIVLSILTIVSGVVFWTLTSQIISSSKQSLQNDVTQSANVVWQKCNNSVVSVKMTYSDSQLFGITKTKFFSGFIAYSENNKFYAIVGDYYFGSIIQQNANGTFTIINNGVLSIANRAMLDVGESYFNAVIAGISESGFAIIEFTPPSSSAFLRDCNSVIFSVDGKNGEGEDVESIIRGQKAVLIGAGIDGESLVTTQGVVSAFTTKNELQGNYIQDRQFQTDSAVAPEMFGCPAFNTSGNLIALIHRRQEPFENTNSWSGSSSVVAEGISYGIKSSSIVAIINANSADIGFSIDLATGKAIAL